MLPILATLQFPEKGEVLAFFVLITHDNVTDDPKILHGQIYMSKGEKTAIGYGLRHGYMGVPDCIL